MSTAITHQRRKPFAWSFSALKNFEACPKKHKAIDLDKKYVEDKSKNEHLVWGDMVHQGLHQRLANKIPLPQNVANYESWARKMEIAAEQMKGQLRVELKFGLTRDFQPCEFFARGVDVWFRSIADVLILAPPYAIVVDWKTGKVKPDSVQLGLSASTIFAHFPDVKHLTTMYVWLEERAETVETFVSDGMAPFWNALWPRVQALEKAYNDQSYPPNPSGLCRNHCPVVECPYHGKGSY